MKRNAFIAMAFILLSGLSNAQFREVKVADDLLNIKAKMPVMLPLPGGGAAVGELIPGQKVMDDVMVGTTWYDLQSYNTVQSRIYAYDDGTIGATYMRANDVGTWSERGSAYNYFDGNAWGPNPAGRIESVRTGWPCYAPLGPTGEIVVSHSVIQTMGLVFNKREVKGEGAWEEFYLPGPEGWDIVWPAMVTNGPDRMNIHILAVTYGDPYEGMTAALLYYRSTDGGQTWNIQHLLMDELNSNYFNSIGGDYYSWAEPKGDTLAFSVGFHMQDGYVMKSYDNGDNWTQVVVYDSPYTPYTGGATPTFCGGDGTQACAIDSQGNVHVVFGRMWHVYDEAGAGSYYPSTEGLVYWNESMLPLDTTTMSTITLDYLIDGGNLIGWIPPNQGDSSLIGYGIYYVSLTSHPQMHIDANDNIYVVWSAPAPGFDNAEMNYRHIFANGSNDGGQYWTGIKDLTTDLMYIFSECVYPVMSPNFANDMVHLTFQTDGLPGINIWTGGHDPVENWIMFQSRDIDDFIVGVDEHRANSIEQRVDVYPNPFEEKFYVSLKGMGAWGHGGMQGSEIKIRVMDLTGRIMQEFNSKEDIIEIDGSGWKPGIYMIMAELGDAVSTGKVVKK
jgi:hypothetical protein